MTVFKRLQTLPGCGEESCFLWGARQTGKSVLLGALFPDSPRYDLLLSHEFARLNAAPWLLREELLASPPGSLPVVVDEVQKVPALLDEIHWLIANRGIQFVLCGSSARKLKRGGGNLLGGRALRYELYPLVYPELPDFDLLRALNHGLLPRHYLARDPERLLRAYVGDYLKEEVAAEALSRNIPAFGRFLEAAAFSNGEMVNYQNIAAECGVSSPTVKEYFQILVDTHLGRFLPAFKRRPKRRVIKAPRFYLFDVGLANVLLRRGRIRPKSEIFGRAFEHFVLQEIWAHAHYSGLEYTVAYWRTASGLEVDCVLGDGEVAIEIKAVEQARPDHLKGLQALREEQRPRHSLLVSLDARPRRSGEITILPWKAFLERLWGGELLG